jgi:hypothetical protein
MTRMLGAAASESESTWPRPQTPARGRRTTHPRIRWAPSHGHRDGPGDGRPLLVASSLRLRDSEAAGTEDPLAQALTGPLGQAVVSPTKRPGTRKPAIEPRPEGGA